MWWKTASGTALEKVLVMVYRRIAEHPVMEDTTAELVRGRGCGCGCGRRCGRHLGEIGAGGTCQVHRVCAFIAYVIVGVAILHAGTDR